ncbi:MAG: CBS domain-containing protein [Acidisphaera sp.]|nr:CBS domain-containing protein [Acidisphaera sp.]
MVTIADVMTTDLVTVSPDTPINEVAALLYNRRISGVPVVDAAGQLLGVVGEGDLIAHAGTVGEQRQSWWLKFFSDTTSLARDYARTHGRLARDVMRTGVATIAETASIAEAAKLFARQQAKRLPVLRDGQLVGIVTRSDLLKVLATSAATPQVSADDRTIRARLLEHLGAQSWARLSNKNIIVENGTVHLFGFVQNDQERQAIRLAAESIAGVNAVEDHLTPELHLPV